MILTGSYENTNTTTNTSLMRQRFIIALTLLYCFNSPKLVQGSLGSINRKPWALSLQSPRAIPTTKNSGQFADEPILLTRTDDGDEKNTAIITRQQINDVLSTTRGGQGYSSTAGSHFGSSSTNKNNAIVRAVGTITQLLLSCGKMVLPPTVAAVKGICGFYRNLPTDAIAAQIGLVYCFAGGYYPTLFSSLQAAQQCGWQVVVAAIDELTTEAIKVIDAMDEELDSTSLPRKDLFLYQTNVVLKTVDPMKINQAAGALYTTWLGVSAVLEKEYARTISLAMALSGYIEHITHWILEPPVRVCVSKDYHRWIPVVIGWSCKGLAMNIAWRIQRVLTAATSAMYGGVMVARSCFRILSRRTKKAWFGRRIIVPMNVVGDEDFDEVQIIEEESSLLDDIIGSIIAGIGFYTQINTQYKNGFSFEVPFPINLLTWPFDWAEKWIQWYITK